MNKEEFKAIILEQIQNPESDIHLYLHPDDKDRKVSKWGPTKITDLTKKHIFCSEFDLRIDVACAMDDRRELNYEVTFSEMVDTVQRDKLDKFKDISKLKDDSILYYKETIEFGLGTLIFCLKPYRLTIKDFVFSAIDAPLEVVLEADTTIQKFLSFNIDVPKYLWSTMKNNGGDMRYIHYLFTNSDKNNMISYLKKMNINNETIDIFTDICSNILYREDSSGLGQVLRGISSRLGYTTY